MKLDIVIVFFIDDVDYVTKFMGIDPYKKKNTELMLYALHPLGDATLHEEFDGYDNLIVYFDLSKNMVLDIWEQWNKWEVWKSMTASDCT